MQYPFRPEFMKRTVLVLGAAALYFGAARLGLMLAFDNTNASPVWPPSGVGLALLLLFGQRLWPGIFIGAFAANLSVFFTNHSGSMSTILMVSGLIAIGNTLEALAGAYLLSRWGSPNPFTKARGVLRFVLVAPLMCAVSACLGPVALALAHVIPWTLFKTVWITWWLGDVAGTLVVAPMLVSWIRRSWIRPDPRWPVEAALLTTVLLFASLLTFSSWMGGSGMQAPLAFLPIPLLVWAAFRFGPCGGSTAIVLTSGLAVWATIHGRGPFGSTDVNSALLLLQMFLGVVTITVLVVAATVQERTDATSALRQAHDELEIRVRDRTVDLESANEHLVQEVAVRRRAEAVLEESQARLAEAQAIAHVGSWDWDMASNEVRWADELYRMCGFEPGEFSVTFEKFLDQVHTEDRDHVSRSVERASQDLQPFAFDYRIVRPDGEVRWIHGRGRVESDETGPLRMFGTALEITERRETEDALRALTDRLQRSNQALEEFASVAAHELQEPLRKIQYFAQRTGGVAVEQDPESAPETPSGFSALRRMQSAVTRMQSLIRDLLEVARLSHKPESVTIVDLTELAHEVVADLDMRIVHLNACVDIGSLPRIEADRTQIRQLFQNLIGNALKFHRPDIHPRIRVSSEFIDSETDPAPSTRAWGPLCRIVVEDNGIGFEPGAAERIFSVFERLHGRSAYEGTGIGLSICRKITDLHGGRIQAEGFPWEGARFTVVLPTRQRAPTMVSRAVSGAQGG